MSASDRQRARRTLAKYAVLQLPGLVAVVAGLAALVRWFDMASWLAGLLLGLWLLKDLALYPFLRVAYEESSRNGTDGLIGALGTVRKRLAPEGWVRVGSELWRAELVREGDAAEVGSEIRVLEVRGMTLRVEPV